MIVPFGNCRSFLVKLDTITSNCLLGDTSATPLAIRSPWRNTTAPFGSSDTRPAASVVTRTAICDIAGTVVHWDRRTVPSAGERFCFEFRCVASLVAPTLRVVASWPGSFCIS